MIIIENKQEITKVFINKNFDYFADSYSFILHSRSTNVYTTFEVEDTLDYVYYFTFDVDFSNMAAGEYEYELKDNDNKLASGIIKIKDDGKTDVIYNSDIKYKTYDPTK